MPSKGTEAMAPHTLWYSCHRLRQRPKPLRPVDDDSGSRLKGSPAFPFPTSCTISICLQAHDVRQH